jgi:hypothetical protein
MALVRCGALFLLFFYFHTGANKFVYLITDLKMAPGELLINVIAGISVPNEPRNFYESSLLVLNLGLLVSSRVKAARRTRGSFERSS